MKGSDLKRIAEDIGDDDTIMILAAGEVLAVNNQTSSFVGDKDASFLVLSADDEELDSEELLRRCMES